MPKAISTRPLAQTTRPRCGTYGGRCWMNGSGCTRCMTPATTIAEALGALTRLGRTDGVDAFAPYADAARSMADWEVRAIPADEPLARSVERVVVGTVIYERAFA